MTRRRKSKLVKKLEKNNDGALLIVAELPMQETGTAQEVMKRAHGDLLTAGDALLNQLSATARKSLSEPVSDEMRHRLSEGDKPERLTSERVRAAVAVAEVSLAIESLIWSRPKRSLKSNKVVVYEQQGLIRLYNQENPLSYQTIPYSYLTARISREIGASDAVSKELLYGIISLIKEGKVRVPGLRAS